MFNVILRGGPGYSAADYDVAVAGCPDSGLASVDFLRAAGLPERPDGRVKLPQIEWPEQEALCRLFAARLDGAADFVVRLPQGVAIPAPLAVEWLAVTARAPLTADFLARVSALIDAAQAAERAERAQREAEQDAARAQREAEAVAAKAQREAEQAEREWAKVASVEKLREWAAGHGGELLRARLAHEAEGVEWVALAEQEWADAAVAPLGAAIPDPYQRKDVTGREARTTPTLDELRRLDAARATLCGRGKFSVACEVSLWWMSGIDIEPFTSLCVDVTTPTGREIERWFEM